MREATMVGRRKHGDEDNSRIMARLNALIALFTPWIKTGVPAGLDYPKSLNAARIWTSAEHGIPVGIGSKRDITTTHDVYGQKVRALAKILKDLKPAKVATKRVYKTAKAQKFAAQDDRDDYKQRLEGVTKQLIEKEYELEEIDRNLKVALHRNQMLKSDNDRLSDQIGRLTRELALKSGGLKVVN
jgi:hypothetical protein